MKVKICGKYWNILFVSGKVIPGKLGDCDPPKTKNKAIRLWNKLRGKKELTIEIHEVLHAADWSKHEDWIEEVAEDVANVLWRLGWRKNDEAKRTNSQDS